MSSQDKQINSSSKRRVSSGDQNKGDSLTESMETIQTVPTDFVENYTDEEDGNVEEPWGRLFPIGSSFTALDLVKDEYLFGRGDDCDYQFNTPLMRKHPCFQAYSKLHFKITRETTKTGVHVFLTDKSSNGTFINGDKVGKNCKHVLNNNDEIALALPKNRAFVFMDNSVNEDANLPAELREKYTLSKLLGRGACGEVKLAFEKGSCKKFAVKIVAKKKFSVGGKTGNNMQKQVMNEVEILKSLKHPCIVNIEDLIDTDDTLFIVLELVEGGELFDRVVSLGMLEEPRAKLLFYQMVQGVKYLHDQGIAHRDLKPENILLSSDSMDTVIKVTDFGPSKFVNALLVMKTYCGIPNYLVTDFGLSKFVNAQSMMKTFCGTPNYLAPEILVTAGNAEYTNAVDCWSLGVILFICLVGYPPFSDERKDMELAKQILGGHYEFAEEYWKDISEDAKQILGGHYEFAEEYWKGISEDAKDLIRKLLTVRPGQRISLEQALEHPWLQDEEVISKARKLMYPNSNGMLPPSSLPTKRKSETEADPDQKSKKKS